MAFFSRWWKDFREADGVLDRLSPSARATLEKSGRTRSMLQSLVEKVGPQSAVEHIEVSNLTGMIDGLDDVVSKAMQQWRAGSASDPHALQRLDAVESDFKPRAEVAIEHVRQASSRPESVAVADAGRKFYASVFKVSARYGMGSITEAEARAAVALKQAWTDACDDWDAATGRARLPLVGG